MENPTQQQQQPYHDLPSPPHSTSIKPLPELPAYTDEPYTDDPPTPTHTALAQQRQHVPSYHDTDTDDIPLAHFLPPQTYPHDAPPSYSVAVRSTHSYHDTLIQYIPNNPQTYNAHALSHTRQVSQHWQTSNAPRVLIEIDEESAEVVSRTDDVRYSVEKVVAMFVVAAVLLVISGVLVWLVVGSGW